MLLGVNMLCGIEFAGIPRNALLEVANTKEIQVTRDKMAFEKLL